MEFAAARVHDEFVPAPNFLNLAIQENLHSGGPAFDFQHIQNSLRGTVAEKLAEGLLVIRNVVFFHQCHEIGRFVPGQC